MLHRRVLIEFAFLNVFQGIWALQVPVPLTVEVITPGTIRVTSGSSLPMTAPAFDRAIEDFGVKYAGKFQFKLTYLTDYSFYTCDDLVAAADFLVADYYYRRKFVSAITVFMMPGCSMECVAVGRFGAGLNQLVFLTSYSNTMMENRQNFPNVIQDGPILMASAIGSLNGLLRYFQWNTTYIVADRAGGSTAVAIAVSSQLLAVLRAQKSLTTYDIMFNTSIGDPIPQVLSDIRKVARVVVYLGHTTALRKFLILAHQANMTRGDYVYIFFYAFEFPIAAYGNLTWQNYDSDDNTARDAFRSLLVINGLPTLGADDTVRLNMSQDLLERSRRDYNYTYVPGDLPSPIALTVYSSMEILGQILEEMTANETMTAACINNSARLAAYFYNRTFQTTLGPYTFNHLGMRQYLSDVKQIDVRTGHFKRVLIQDGVKIGTFLPVAELDWLSGVPPPDVPKCGFSGAIGSCSQLGRVPASMIAGTALGVTFVLLVIGFIIYSFVQDRKHMNDWQLTDALCYATPSGVPSKPNQPIAGQS